MLNFTGVTIVPKHILRLVDPSAWAEPYVGVIDCQLWAEPIDTSEAEWEGEAAWPFRPDDYLFTFPNPSVPGQIMCVHGYDADGSSGFSYYVSFNPEEGFFING